MTDCTYHDGILTMENGLQIDILNIQATLCAGFAEFGLQTFADCAADLAMLTGKVIDGHGVITDA